MRAVVCLLTTLLFVTSAMAHDVATSTKPIPVKGPLSPEESLKHFVLADENLQIEIVAAEPEVIDPVAIQFDEHGRLWVVELSDYPTGPEPGQPPMSRIKLLEDKDGDGRYETAHVFADKLLFATGVQPWDGGVIMTLAGEVAYFKDTDGDHKADVRETWFTGFAESNPQLRANHPTFGPDGWIYVANGLRGGNVIAVKKDWPVKVRREGEAPAEPRSKHNQPSTARQEPRPPGTAHDPANPQPVSLTGRDFKFDPLTGRYEAISGNGQFGMTFDAWGNRFVCDNRHPCRHVIFEEDFIKRCPHVAFPAVVHDVIPADDKNQVFPLTSAWTTSNLHAGTFTASCGVTVYTGDWLPEEFRGNVFVCEPTGNLVQRAILEPDGVTFKSRNPYQQVSGKALAAGQTGTDKPARDSTPPAASAVPLTNGTQEFLASRDDWFRPVDLQNGPDGALYVVDMYRAVIEHPEWVPDELKKRPDTWLGNDKGRIYRIRPKSSPHAPREEQPSPRATSDVQSTSTARSALLTRSVRATFGKPIISVANIDAAINSSNGWDRITASRVAHQQRSKSDTVLNPRKEAATCLVLRSPLLLKMARPTFLAECLTKEGAAGNIAVQTLGQLFEEPSSYKEIYVLSDLIVRGDIFFILRGLAPFQAEVTYLTPALYDEAANAASDPWKRLIFVAAFQNNAQRLALSLFDKRYGIGRELSRRHDPALKLDDVLALTEMIGELVGMQSELQNIAEVIVTWSAEVTEDSKSHDDVLIAAAGIRGIATVLGRRSLTIPKLLQSRSAEENKAFETLLRRAIEVAKTPSATRSSTATIEAVRLLRHSQSQDITLELQQLAESSTNQTLRLAATESFASFPKPEVDAWLIERYRSETPAIRRAILAALFASKERQLRLLEAIEQGEIAATELDPVRVNQLTQAKDETLRERAKTVLAAAAPASRKEVLEAYQPALSLTGDPKRGRELFVKNCSTCHRVDNVGVNVAPDISDTRTKKPEQLLLDILDPNKAIDANYFAYAVVTKEGKTESGVISAETATSITLKQPEGKVLTLLRSDIEELRNTGLSLMPVGVEKNIDQQALADLIFWLKNWRYLDGKVPATSLK